MHVDVKPSSGATHRALLYALLASLIAHLFGLLYFDNQAIRVNSFPANNHTSSFKVTLNTLQLTQTLESSPAETQESAPEFAASISMADSPQLPAMGQKRHAQNNPKISKLKIPSTTVEIRHFLQEAPKVSNIQTTVNGAVVMNQTVRTALQQNPGIKNFTTAAADSHRPATYDAGSWTEWVQLGDKCFQVKKANPLETYSNEIWYRTACH